MALRVEGFPVVSGGMLFGVWLLPLYGSSVCPTPAGSVRCVPSRYSEAGHGAAMRWGAPAHEKLKGGRTMRSCALEGKCMLWLRYAGARRRQSETQAGREVPVVGDADAKELQSGGSGLSEGGHRAQVRLPGLAAHLRGRTCWCVPVQRIHRI